MNVAALLRASLALSCALLVAGCATSPETARGQTAALDIDAMQVETRRLAIPVGAQIAALHLINPHGELRLRIGEPGELGIVATVQRFGSAGATPEIVQQIKGDQLAVSVVYPFGPPPVDPASGRADHTRGRADLAVFVPPNLALELETTDGRIQVRRAKGDVSARSVSGIVDVSAAGTLNLSSGSGRVVARQESGTWAGESRIETTTGVVLVALPMTADITLALQSAGPITLDPGIQGAERSVVDGVNQARIVFGQGRLVFSVRSASGGIHVVPVLAAPPPR